MPYANGTYTTPAWVNNRPPFVVADELTAMCDTAAQGQTRVADFRMSADTLNLGTDKNLQSLKTKPSFLFTTNKQVQELSSYKFASLSANFQSFVGFPTISNLNTKFLSTYNNLEDYFLWLPDSGASYYINSKTDSTATSADLFSNYTTITDASVSINNYGIGLASAFVDGSSFVMAYTLNGGRSWNNLTGLSGVFGYVKSVIVNDDGSGMIFADDSYYFENYAFLQNDVSVLQNVNPFAGQGVVSAAFCSKLCINSNGYGIYFYQDTNNDIEFCGYTLDNGKTWTTKALPSALEGKTIYYLLLLDSNGFLITTAQDRTEAFSGELGLQGIDKLSNSFSLSDCRFLFANKTCIEGTNIWGELTAMKGIVNGGLIWEDWWMGFMSNAPFAAAVNDNNKVFSLYLRGSGIAYAGVIGYPYCDYGRLVTDQIAPF